MFFTISRFVPVATMTMFMIGNPTMTKTATARVAIDTPHQAKNNGTRRTSGVAPSVTANGPNSQRVPFDMPAIIPKNTPARSAGRRPIRRAVMLSPKSRRNSSLGASSIALCRTDGKLGSLAVLSIIGAATTQASAIRASPMMASSSVLTKGGIQYSPISKAVREPIMWPSRKHA